MARLIFRPLPALTIAAIPTLFLLLTLGVWQTQRAQWKADLMRDYVAAEAAPSVPLAQALCAGDSVRVRLDTSPQGSEIRMFGAGPQGQAGWRIIAAAPAPACDADAGRGSAPTQVLVQTGFEPLTDATIRLPAPADGLLLEQWPEASAFTPDNAPDVGDFYRFDAAQMAQALNLGDAHIAPLWAHWEARDAVDRVRTAPETHIGYAVTWFGLALALIAIYAVMHMRVGRLGFRRS